MRIERMQERPLRMAKLHEPMHRLDQKELERMA